VTTKKKYSSPTVQDNFEWFVYFHGGYKCERCGYDGLAIDFHHLNPEQKKNYKDGFANTIKASREVFCQWVKKTRYVLLCSNCHRELHGGSWEIAEIIGRIEERMAAQSRRREFIRSRSCERLLNAILHSNTEIIQVR
jgi:hypothetical protein